MLSLVVRMNTFWSPFQDFFHPHNCFSFCSSSLLPLSIFPPYLVSSTAAIPHHRPPKKTKSFRLLTSSILSFYAVFIHFPPPRSFFPRLPFANFLGLSYAEVQKKGVPAGPQSHAPSSLLLSSPCILPTGSYPFCFSCTSFPKTLLTHERFGVSMSFFNLIFLLPPGFPLTLPLTNLQCQFPNFSFKTERKVRSSTTVSFHPLETLYPNFLHYNGFSLWIRDHVDCLRLFEESYHSLLPRLTFPISPNPFK